MAKLTDDPKVAAFVEKEIARASAALKKLHLAAIKERIAAAVDDLKTSGNPAGAKAMKAVGADLAAKLKEVQA